MATMRDIRRRIRSIKNTQQITKAMQMVAAAKLRKVQDRVVASRPYATKLREVLGRLVLQVPPGEYHPLLAERLGRRSAYVVVTGDRGLCGAYNANVIRLAERELTAAGPEAVVLAVGRKGRDYFRRQKYPLLRTYVDLGDDPSFPQARELARELMALFLEQAFDHLYLVYTQFLSPVRQQPQVVPLLPIRRPTGAEKAVEYIFEPRPPLLFQSLLPRYVEVQVYQMLLEAKASEHGARMTAMEAATDNAEEMIKRLTLSFNKARQAAITKELADIVGTARAFEQ
ncbi:MAG: F0F1 ATP synthase subunit gamma [Clostridia bacterium]|nr:F0F1 ATP synthase subunit gamma [Clostridia bacterium]